MNTFEIIDKTGRKIRLTKKQWTHIREDHPEIENEEVIKESLEKPLQIISASKTKAYYYRYYKERQDSDKFLLIVVKYLNGTEFVITAFYLNKIK
ncbi:hypothetical protein J4402_02310 [Candidatus Pacearchaeota archaeon]|nr:hypothetical protein [uncultured archaeon]AQS31893.1 hypothetical protein [uncultured archaeon]MBS3088591.1 hypothetical protein [Candidatus Pacearchaeota archaeon]